MKPYFPTMASMLPSGYRRANMSWTEPWSKYGYTNSSAYVSQGHPAYARWGTDLEHVEFGSGALVGDRVKGGSPGGYKGAQMACAMGPWNNMGQVSTATSCSLKLLCCTAFCADSVCSVEGQRSALRRRADGRALR